MGISRISHAIVWLLFLWLPWSTAFPQLTKEDWQHAEFAIVRVSPDDFPGLPADVRTVLELRGCTVPQPYNAGVQKRNVISGQFTSAGQTDWAVLCSHEKHSMILVFHGTHAGYVDTLAEESDAQYLQVVSGEREIGYSRQLMVASPKLVRRRFSKGTLRTAAHDGIENIFVGKASVVWYRSGGKWISAPASE